MGQFHAIIDQWSKETEQRMTAVWRQSIDDLAEGYEPHPRQWRAIAAPDRKPNAQLASIDQRHAFNRRA